MALIVADLWRLSAREFVDAVHALRRAEIAALLEEREARLFAAGADFERASWTSLTLERAKSRLARLVFEIHGSRLAAAKALGITYRTMTRAKWLDSHETARTPATRRVDP